jgi:uncharacterized protein
MGREDPRSPAAGTPRPADAAASAERIVVLDALRGLALYGILLANVLYWSGWSFHKPEAALALAGERQVAAQYLFHHLIVDGKFYTLFSLLFGVGFSLQLARLERRGADGVAIFRRRLLVLLAIGLVHCVLVWDGDILTLYALLGLTLPFFRGWSERSLLAAVVLLTLLPLAGAATFAALGWEPHRWWFELGDDIGRRLGGTPELPNAWLQRPDFGAYFAWTMGGWPYRVGTLIESWRIPKVLGIMLLGLVLGRRLVAGSLLQQRRLLWTTLAAGLAIGVPAGLVYGTTTGVGQDSAASIVGTLPMALAYAAAFLLAWPRAARVLGVLAAPGRMALTNYLMQTLLGITIFYGIGFGLVGRLAPAEIYAIATAVYAGQIAFSHWWLARHEMGPMERLWRTATYGRRVVAVER